MGLECFFSGVGNEVFVYMLDGFSLQRALPLLLQTTSCPPNLLSLLQVTAMCLLQANIVRPRFLSVPRNTIHVGMGLAVWTTSHITRVSVWWGILERTVLST